MILFKTIRWKNLLSTGNAFTEINLSASQTTLLVGKNGAGKSTLADAITYALFSKPFRKIAKPQLVNSINKKDFLVEIEFSIGSVEYVIRRGQRPNIFEIFQNGVMLNQDAANRDYQEVLEKQILKMNYKTFCQVVILGTASFVPFMQLNTGQRREIIEDILDLQIFSSMNNLLKEKVQNNTADVKAAEYEMRLVEQKISLQEKHLETLLRDADSLIEKLNLKITDDIESITVYNDTIRSNTARREELLSGLNEDPSRLTSRLSKVNTLYDQLESKVSRLNDEISFYVDNAVCPTCHQDISEDFKHEHVEQKNAIVAETTGAMTRLQEELKKTRSKLDEVNSIYDECSKMNVTNSVAMSSIQGLERQVAQHRADILKLHEKKSSFKGDEADLSKLAREKSKLEKQKAKLLEEKGLYSVSLMMLKDNGIKSKIIKQYVPLINKYINKYLSSMDFFVSFELDENFNETIKARGRDDFSYTSFSEGEKSRINLAILFTWRTIAKLRNSASTNLLIFDEIFDGSLDGDGTEEFMKILETAAPESNVFVISHKTDAMLDRFDRVIRFTKVKNFSEIEE